MKEKIKIAASPEPGERKDNHLRPVLDDLIKTKGNHHLPDGDQLQNMRYYHEINLGGRYLDVDDIEGKFEFPETIKVYKTGIVDKLNAVEFSLILDRTGEEEAKLDELQRKGFEKLKKDPDLLRKLSLGMSDS